MNARIAEHIRKVTESTALLSAFGQKFDIPEGIGWPAADESGASFTVHLGSRSKSDHERALQVMGDIFGRTGWIAKRGVGSYSNGFDWRKEVDGVKLAIFDAETMPPMEDGIPVPPSKFPIQLEETARE